MNGYDKKLNGSTEVVWKTHALSLQCKLPDTATPYLNSFKSCSIHSDSLLVINGVYLASVTRGKKCEFQVCQVNITSQKLDKPKYVHTQLADQNTKSRAERQRFENHFHYGDHTFSPSLHPSAWHLQSPARAAPKQPCIFHRLSPVSARAVWGVSELHPHWPRIAPGPSPCSPGAWTQVLKIHLRVFESNTGAPGSLQNEELWL